MNFKWEDGVGNIHSGEMLHNDNNFKIIKCDFCRFSHATPIPTEEELINVYKHDYYLNEKPLYLDQYLEDKEWWINTYSTRYEVLEEILPPNRRKILDIGSGPGLFLLTGKMRGWTVKGLEPSSSASKFTRQELGLDVDPVLLNAESAKNLGKFDALNMSLVLEHIPNPASMLKLSYSLLNDDGLLCVSVPNDFNPFQKILNQSLGFSPWWVAPPHHINYFNSESLKELFARNGFKTIHQTVTFPIDVFLLMGKNYIGNDSLGRECHIMRKNFESNMFNSGNGDLLAKLYESFANIGIGRELVMIAKKEG